VCIHVVVDRVRPIIAMQTAPQRNSWRSTSRIALRWSAPANVESQLMLLRRVVLVELSGPGKACTDAHLVHENNARSALNLPLLCLCLPFAVPFSLCLFKRCGGRGYSCQSLCDSDAFQCASSNRGGGCPCLARRTRPKSTDLPYTPSPFPHVTVALRRQWHFHSLPSSIIFHALLSLRFSTQL